MAGNLRGKRPCSICRKWFQPDVRQKGRQKTCSSDCKQELHRRHCEKWNKKNREYSKNNYLDDILEEIEAQQPESRPAQADFHKQQSSKPQTKPVLPYEIIAREYGIRTMVIIKYIVYQITNQTRSRVAGFP